MGPSPETVRDLPLLADLNTAEIEGARLVYRERGSGEPVVFVHGALSDLTIWEPQLQALGDDYRAIAYSRRYAWPNDDLATEQKDMMQPHVEDLLAFLRAVDAYPAHLVGNSWGAFICLRAGIQEPDAVRSLALEEPPLVPLIIGAPPAPSHIFRSLLREPKVTLAVLRFGAGTLTPATKLLKAGDLGASVDRFARGVLGEKAFERLPEEARAHMRANAQTHAGQVLADGGFEPITQSEIRSVSAPTLVLTGAESPAMFRRLARLLASLLRHSSLLEVPSASHLMHFENPPAVNDGLAHFLAGVGSRLD